MNKIDFSCFKGAIFDLDGTLLDSMDVWNKIDTQFLSKRGLTQPDDYLQKVAAMGAVPSAKYTKELFNLDMSEEEIIAEWFAMAKIAYAKEIQAKPGAIRFVRYLKSLGYQLAVATSGSEELFLPTLKRLQIDTCFDYFVTSAMVGVSKNQPDIYLQCAKQMNLNPSECLVFEDILSAVRSAASREFYTVAIYEPHNAKEQQEIQKTSHLYIHSFEEILS